MTGFVLANARLSVNTHAAPVSIKPRFVAPLTSSNISVSSAGQGLPINRLLLQAHNSLLPFVQVRTAARRTGYSAQVVCQKKAKSASSTAKSSSSRQKKVKSVTSPAKSEASTDGTSISALRKCSKVSCLSWLLLKSEGRLHGSNYVTMLLSCTFYLLTQLQDVNGLCCNRCS